MKKYRQPVREFHCGSKEALLERLLVDRTILCTVTVHSSFRQVQRDTGRVRQLRDSYFTVVPHRTSGTLTCVSVLRIFKVSAEVTEPSRTGSFLYSDLETWLLFGCSQSEAVFDLRQHVIGQGFQTKRLISNEVLCWFWTTLRALVSMLVSWLFSPDQKYWFYINWSPFRSS